jgi:hypothetical protein
MRNVYLFGMNSPSSSGASREGLTATGSGFIRIDLDKPFILTKIMFLIQSNTSGATVPSAYELRFTELASGRKLFQVNASGIDDGWLPARLFTGTGPDRTAISFLNLFFPQLPEECELPAGGLVQVDLQYRITPGVTGIDLGGTAYCSFLGYSYE